MALDIKVPTVGESINEVTLSRWLKKDGDYVQQDEVLCEIESDKATFELNAEKPGNLKIMVKEGETIKIGTVVAQIDTDVAASAKQEAPKQKETIKAAVSAPPATASQTVGEGNTNYASGTP